MRTIRIFQPSKTAMQSGRGKTKNWVIEFETDDPLIAEPLMGWVASQDMSLQLHLTFSSLEKALHFAKVKGLQYTVCHPPQIFLVPKSYGINFTCPRMRGT
jgi:hypothetical protein